MGHFSQDRQVVLRTDVPQTSVAGHTAHFLLNDTSTVGGRVCQAQAAGGPPLTNEAEDGRGQSTLAAGGTSPVCVSQGTPMSGAPMHREATGLLASLGLPHCPALCQPLSRMEDFCDFWTMSCDLLLQKGKDKNGT